VEVRLWSQFGARTKRPSGEGLCCPKRIANVLGTVSGIAGFDHQMLWRLSNTVFNGRIILIMEETTLHKKALHFTNSAGLELVASGGCVR